jgi:hypothetical protein
MTGFEPATSASRTQRSTKLSHIPKGTELYHGVPALALVHFGPIVRALNW